MIHNAVDTPDPALKIIKLWERYNHIEAEIKILRDRKEIILQEIQKLSNLDERTTPREDGIDEVSEWQLQSTFPKVIQGQKP